MAAVLEYLFPNQTRFFTEQAFADMAVEGGMSTFYSGIHFRRDVEADIRLGRDMAAAVTTRAAGDGADGY